MEKIFNVHHIRSDQISRSVVSDSLRPHESQHARPPCPSPTPGVHSDSRPLSQWCHPVISSSVVPFSSCPQSLPASQSFPMSQLFAWGGQSTGVSALASFLQRNPRADLCSSRDSQESSPTPHSKASILQHSAFFTVQLSHPYMTTGKTKGKEHTLNFLWSNIHKIHYLSLSKYAVPWQIYFIHSIVQPLLPSISKTFHHLHNISSSP